MSQTSTLSRQAFIELALEAGVLKFGSFTLKSGRQSPYFFNAGLFYQGQHLQRLGQFYAQALLDSGLPFQHLFGPAYKGLPLATATAIALAGHGVDCTVTFNRKEVKDHGEGGILIGAPLQGDTVIIDDVITAGTAFREAAQQIRDQGANLTAVVIALDRCERGSGKESTLREIEAQGVRVLSIISLHDLIAYMEGIHEHDKVAHLRAYHAQYGC